MAWFGVYSQMEPEVQKRGTGSKWKLNRFMVIKSKEECSQNGETGKTSGTGKT